MSNQVSFNQQCEFIARQNIPRLASITLFFVSILMVAVFTYSFFVEVDVKATVTGVFEFGAKNKYFVESDAPGVIHEVLVKTGQQVSKGEVLMTMQNQSLIETYDEENSRLKSLQLYLHRLKSEKDGRNLVFSEQDSLKFPEMVKNESYDASMDIKKYQAEKKELEEIYFIADREYELMLPLFEGGHISAFEMEKQKRKVDAAKAALGGIDERRVTKLAEDIKQTYNNIDEQEKKVARLHEQVLGLKVRAPFDGIVSSKSFSTRGANVKKGDRLVELVEPNSEFVVNLTVSPAKIGFIKVGQPVNIKVDSYDFSIYGKIEGEVTSISYTPVLKNATTVYEVSVKPKTQYLEYKGKKMDLISGMTCVVDILTNKVSLMNYLMKPVTKNYTSGNL